MRGGKATKKGKQRKEKAPKVTMHLDEFVGRETGDVYEDENGVLHRTAEAAGLDYYANKLVILAARSLGINIVYM